MCGIVGAVGSIDQSIVDAIAKANDAMVHRGPDGEGLWHTELDQQGVILAHRRLAIIELSELGAQPMADLASSCVISFNGEIYNFQYLREALIAEGVQFTSHSDTEVILKSYARWGKECVNHFEGMFAFAIYDPEQGEVFIARDPTGIKPLYYTVIAHPQGNKTLLFASELKTLLASNLINRKLNPQALATYLWNGFVIEPLSMVKNVHLLPAGHTLTVNMAADFFDKCYWVNPVREPRPNFDKKAFYQSLEKIVEQHLVSDVPVGVFLSGGVDSSFIATLAARRSEEPINTFCITFSESKYAESHYAKEVADAIGSKHHEFLLTDDYFKAHLDDALDSLDQPTFDGINTYYVSRAVAESGIKVALAGTGGDELFGGYPSFNEIPLINRCAFFLRLIPVGLRKFLAGCVIRVMQGAQSLPPQTRWGKLADLLGGRMDVIGAYQVSYGLFTEKFLAMLSPKYYSSVSEGLPQAMRNRLEQSTLSGSTRQAISVVEENLFLGQRLLRDSDACSMKESLEVRVPLAGKEVFELVNRVPDRFRFFPKGKKKLLRDAVTDDLPKGIFDRPKRGFELPMDVWLKSSLAERGERLFFDDELVTKVGLDTETVKQLWTAFQSGEKGFYWSRIWSIYVLLWWCSTYEVYL